jgi:hypothetical protein
MTATSASVQGRWQAVAGLRRWADGAATDVAAVELLIALGARFTDPRCRWIRRCPRAGWYWLDPNPLARLTGRLTANERRVLAVIVALLSGEPATAMSRRPDIEAVLGRAA